MGFPDGASGKELTYQRRRHKRAGFDPWVWKIPWRRAIQPTPVFLPGESYGQRSLAGYSPWGRKESKTIERLNSDKTDAWQTRSLKATKADLDLHLLPEHRHLIYKDSCGPASALSWHDWSDLACTHTKVCVQYWGRGQRAPLEPRLSGFSEAAGCSVFFHCILSGGTKLWLVPLLMTFTWVTQLGECQPVSPSVKALVSALLLITISWGGMSKLFEYHVPHQFSLSFMYIYSFTYFFYLFFHLFISYVLVSCFIHQVISSYNFVFWRSYCPQFGHQKPQQDVFCYLETQIWVFCMLIAIWVSLLLGKGRKIQT